MVRRRGAGAVGCLFGLLVAAAIAYFAVNVGEVYLRRYRLEDAMRQEARFASRRTDAQIRQRLAALADSLDMPEGARRILIRRSGRHIGISAEYYETIELPGIVREVHMQPHAEWTW